MNVITKKNYFSIFYRLRIYFWSVQVQLCIHIQAKSKSCPRRKKHIHILMQRENCEFSSTKFSFTIYVFSDPERQAKGSHTATFLFRVSVLVIVCGSHKICFVLEYGVINDPNIPTKVPIQHFVYLTYTTT